jgi:hypothetical protein
LRRGKQASDAGLVGGRASGREEFGAGSTAQVAGSAAVGNVASQKVMTAAGMSFVHPLQYDGKDAVDARNYRATIGRLDAPSAG